VRHWGTAAWFMSFLVIGAACTGSTAEIFGSGASGGVGASGSPCTVQGKTCAVHCDPQFGCVDCRDDSDCGASLPGCVDGECRECAQSSDCPTGEACVLGKGECEPACASDGDCKDDERCHPVSKSCGECLSGDDCPQDTPACSPALRCGECGSDDDCPTAEAYCELKSEARCRECLVDAHCALGKLCVDHDCLVPCVDDQDCVGMTDAHCDLELKVCLN
jgi:hypothetical protein